ncbi:MAG: CpaF family protein [Anaerolineales bacterium]
MPTILPNSPEYTQLRQFLLARLAQRLESLHLSGQEARTAAEQAFTQLLASAKVNLSPETQTALQNEIINDLIGYGPLQSLLEDPTISEIMVSGPKQIYIERDGTLIDTQLTFEDDSHVLRVIDRIIRPLGRSVDRDTPLMDARLPDGSRVNVVIPPVAIDGASITIRKFLKNKLTMQEIIEMGTLTPAMSNFLRACVVARLNILITGNTSSGKTTFLNLLSSFIPNEERIITIEDAAELQLKQKYVVRLESRPAGPNGSEITIRDLVKNALRMRPDRIIVGEVRGGEALDMLQAMNTGHTGSLTTLHANTPRDAIARIETMSLMAGIDMPIIAIRKQVVAAIDAIVHLARMEDGSRKITHITELSGMEGDTPTLTDIFKFERTGVGQGGKILGELRPTRLRPYFMHKLENAGFKLGGEIFGAGMF